MPIVSIILPTFNRLAYLRAAIDSVFAQTFADWELIVADDGSSAETLHYLRGLKDPRAVVLWRSHCANPARVRNAAIGQARGQYLAFLDSDDVWAPRKLEKQVAALRDRPDRRWCYTLCDCIDPRGAPVPGVDQQPPGEGWILEPLLSRLSSQIGMPALMADRLLVQDLGGFDEGQRFCEDHDLCLRLAMRSEVSVVSEILCSIRLDGDSYSADRIGEHVGRLRLYGKMAALVEDPRLRAICQRMRAAQSLVLAGLLGDRRDLRGLWRTLRNASGYAWHYPDWWLGALKAIARPALPAPLLSAYRQLQGRRAR